MSPRLGITLMLYVRACDGKVYIGSLKDPAKAYAFESRHAHVFFRKIKMENKPSVSSDNFKQKWIEALRSGKYEQGKACLKTEDSKFCCLGVACDITNPNGWYKEDGKTYFNGGHKAYAPEYIVSYRNIDQDELASMNDRGISFSEIADYIEKFYKE